VSADASCIPPLIFYRLRRAARSILPAMSDISRGRLQEERKRWRRDHPPTPTRTMDARRPAPTSPWLHDTRRRGLSTCACSYRGCSVAERARRYSLPRLADRSFTVNYPHEPPECKFGKAPGGEVLFHPNVYSDGTIYLRKLTPDERPARVRRRCRRSQSQQEAICTTGVDADDDDQAAPPRHSGIAGASTPAQGRRRAAESTRPQTHPKHRLRVFIGERAEAARGSEEGQALGWGGAQRVQAQQR